MKKSYKNNICLLAIMQIFLFAGHSLAQERDPFSPTGSMMNRVKEMVGGNTSEQPTKMFDNVSPLASTQLSGYKVIGVIIADSDKIASVKAINGVSYIVKIGDSLGSEGGKISDINVEGISVQTESQEIKLPVSNIVEVPLENAEKKK